MNMYTNEFINAMEKIEEDVEVSISEWINEINADSMIEARNISIGDSNEFKGGFFINPKTHKIDISNEMKWGKKDTVDDVGRRVCKKVKDSLQELVEEKIESSDIPITKAKDVRKFIKVVYLDSLISLDDFSLHLRIGIEEHKMVKG